MGDGCGALNRIRKRFVRPRIALHIYPDYRQSGSPRHRSPRDVFGGPPRSSSPRALRRVGSRRSVLPSSAGSIPLSRLSASGSRFLSGESLSGVHLRRSRPPFPVGAKPTFTSKSLARRDSESRLARIENVGTLERGVVVEDARVAFPLEASTLSSPSSPTYPAPLGRPPRFMRVGDDPKQE